MPIIILFCRRKNYQSIFLKLNLSCNRDLEDHHLKTLVERSNKITELDLGSTSITNDSVGSIVTNLKSLKKLDVSYTKIDSIALIQLGSVKTLMFLRWQNIEIDKKIDQIRFLRKKITSAQHQYQLFVKYCHINLKHFSIRRWILGN